MAQKCETPAIEAGASRSLPGGCFRDFNSLMAMDLQAHLASAPYSELVDDGLLPRWRDLAGLATLGEALAMAGKVRRDRLAGSDWYV